MYKNYIKRILDIILSVIILIIFLPLYIIIALLIIIIHKNKIIYKQVRTGKNGKNFNIYKFTTFKGGKVTKFGKILRLLSFDELPQMMNILKGDMSFIGPRPWITDYYKYMNKDQRRRVEVLPGLTGLAQISGRNDISIFDKINNDLQYVDNISFLLDIKIVFKTIKVMICSEDGNNMNDNIKNEINELKENNK